MSLKEEMYRAADTHNSMLKTEIAVQKDSEKFSHLQLVIKDLQEENSRLKQARVHLDLEEPNVHHVAAAEILEQAGEINHISEAQRVAEILVQKKMAEASEQAAKVSHFAST